MRQNGRMGVAAAQTVPFRCSCGSVDFQLVSLTRLFTDRLAPNNMLIQGTIAYRCLSCEGWVERDKEAGGFKVTPSVIPGDEWKG